MTLEEAITSTGMTPPRQIVSGRWLRFPGIGKGSSNRSGWCRVITPTLAYYGDWSSRLSAEWRDDAHVDDETSKRLLAEARQREQQYFAKQRRRQAQAEERAARIVRESHSKHHPYLERKGFPQLYGLIHQGEPIVPEGNEILGAQLVVPMRDASSYDRIVSAQLIDERGKKVFLPGGRAQRAIYRIGVNPDRAKRIWLCEGYATALSIDAAVKRLPGPHAVIVCYSASNLEIVADGFPRAVVCADHDESGAGQAAAQKTGLQYVMPQERGDFNDLHLRHGLHAVAEVLRPLI